MPVLRFGWLTPLYDVLVRLLLPERRFRAALLTGAGLRPGERVLDFGCGTGTLLGMAVAAQPSAQYVGLDPDPAVLAIAGRKLRRTGVAPAVQLVPYDGGHIPFPDGYFDKILCSLVFCNLTPEGKRAALRELRRVLRPGGTLYVVEWGPPVAFWVRPGFWLLQAVGGFVTTRDLAAGKLPGYLREAGFAGVGEEKLTNTAFGTLYRYGCHCPPAQK
jgi:ubiquinone/menaquinone biosynthesis C-methylase UbiE